VDVAILLEVLLFLLPSKLLLRVAEMTLFVAALGAEGLVVGAGDQNQLDPASSDVLFVEVSLSLARSLSVFKHGDCLSSSLAVGVGADLDSFLFKAVSMEELDDLFD
jgi:hypothetical protein